MELSLGQSNLLLTLEASTGAANSPRVAVRPRTARSLMNMLFFFVVSCRKG